MLGRKQSRGTCSLGPGEVIVKRAISVLAVLVVIALGLWLQACNTSRGFGKDIESVGASMKNSAERHGAE